MIYIRYRKDKDINWN